MRLDGVDNFRELGGLVTADGRRVRAGSIFRSGHLAGASDADLDALGRFGVVTVVDFRNQVDLAAEGDDRLPAGATLERIELLDGVGHNAEIRSVLAGRDRAAIEAAFGNGRSRELAIQGARSFVTHPEVGRRYGDFLDLVAGADRRPLLFHCSAGKDRAGWAASIVLLALGVPRDTLVEHYLESNAHRRVVEHLARLEGAGMDPEILRPFIEVHEDYAQASLAAVDEHWGGTERYLRDGLGFGPERVEQLRDQLLE